MIPIVEYSEQQKQGRSSQVITEFEELCEHHLREKSRLDLERSGVAIKAYFKPASRNRRHGGKSKTPNRCLKSKSLRQTEHGTIFGKNEPPEKLHL